MVAASVHDRAHTPLRDAQVVGQPGLRHSERLDEVTWQHFDRRDGTAASTNPLLSASRSPFGAPLNSRRMSSACCARPAAAGTEIRQDDDRLLLIRQASHIAAEVSIAALVPKAADTDSVRAADFALDAARAAEYLGDVPASVMEP